MMRLLMKIMFYTLIDWLFLLPCPMNKYSELRRVKNRTPARSCACAWALGWWAFVKT